MKRRGAYGWMAAGLLVWAGAALRAQEPEAAAPAADEAAFRDPFAPIGYQPTGARPATNAEAPSGTLQIANMSPEQQARLRSKLQVSGIMRAGQDFVALVNDSLIGAGDVLEVDFEGQRLRLVVQAIDKETIKLEPAPE